MKIKSTHPTYFGSFAPNCPTGQDGYIVHHDSPRYSSATADQLASWQESRYAAVRAAASVEIAQRNISEAEQQ